MNPSIKNFSEHSDVLYFTLHGVEVSIANAIRRTILSDIPTIVIETADSATAFATTTTATVGKPTKFSVRY